MITWARYTLTFDDTCSDVVVDVRAPESDEMIALCTLINEFWSGADDRLAEADDDVVVAVLNMLCRRALAEEISSGLGAVHEFAVQGVEGWPLLDGSDGIKLVSADRIDFDNEVSIRMELIEVAA
ncbi:DUF2528 family protein [Duganella violaceipulchra]|uniref:DUF2528 family protein n=1 Tax=Duganella violaceipulchra TaxID=2849652 RepID=A0AA41L045_9BURK|nr:DUF2528 family protein [Duganella violaceicalia]MBV6321971.1 DUF2528 family protein [Duganella violaceicalia]MCP2007033.1 hypothetical protein [Duganella violaceicalia]